LSFIQQQVVECGGDNTVMRGWRQPLFKYN
jgi:hypothetical protein